MKVAELESVFTADTSQFDKQATKVETKQKQLDGTKAEVIVDADTGKALAAMDRVESAAGSIPKGTVEVDADTSKAEAELDGIGDSASKAGGEGGKAFMAGLLGGLASTPIAGAVVGLASDIGQMFTDAFQVEVRGDRLMALTGLDAASSARLGRAASEAYASNFGESLEANFETARLAVQSGLLDPASTEKASQKVIESLSGVADFMSEDVSRIARSTAQLLRTGLAKDAGEAFDIIVTGAQNGLNVSEDWLDTLDEYSTQFRKLGLDGPHAIGLISQGLKAGARDTDTVADALKEFSIRAVDGSKTSADAYELIGLSAQEMTAQIALGGESASAGLQTVLEHLKGIEDPVAREAAAVGLFGTKAEDLGAALYALDFTTATAGMEAFAGSAAAALATIGDNAAADIESAQRNIKVAADGIKGALAQAFNPQIESFAEYVQENRAEVMTFLLELANGALEFGMGFVEGLATATEGVGDFVSDVIPALLDGIGSVIKGIDKLVPGDQGAEDWEEFAKGAKESLAKFDESTEQTAETMRTELIEKGLIPAQERLNEFGMPLVAQAALHDAMVATATDIAVVGVNADGTSAQLANFNGTVDTSTEAGRLLDEQIRTVVGGMQEQADAAIGAGQGVDETTAALQANRDELVLQLQQMGLTEDQAKALADQYGAIPTDITTTATMEAETAAAQAAVDRFKNQRVVLTAEISASGQPVYRTANGQKFEHDGGILTPMAAGGFAGAEMVKPNTWRIVGDRLDVDEAYVPLDGSSRSWGILQEALRRMPGVTPMAAGGITAAAPAASSGTAPTINQYDVHVTIPVEDIRGLSDVVEFMQTIRRRTRQKIGVN